MILGSPNSDPNRDWDMAQATKAARGRIAKATARRRISRLNECTSEEKLKQLKDSIPMVSCNMVQTMQVASQHCMHRIKRATERPHRLRIIFCDSAQLSRMSCLLLKIATSTWLPVSTSSRLRLKRILRLFAILLLILFHHIHEYNDRVAML